MIFAPATVVDRRAGELIARVEPLPGCATCGSGAGCGLGPLLNLFVRNTPQTIILEEENIEDFSVGDRVRVEISGPRLALSALVAYALPLAGLFSGAGLGGATGHDGLAAAGAVAGLLVAAAVLRGAERTGGVTRGLAAVALVR